MSFTATIEIYQPDGITLKSPTYSEVIGVQASEELVFRDTVTFTIEAMGGMGSGSFTLFKDKDTVNAVVGDMVKIKEDSTVVYVGKIAAMPKDQTDINPYADRVSFVCENILNADTRKLFYSLTEPSGAPVPTYIQDILTDIFKGGKYADKGQENNIPIEDNSIVTYAEGNNTLPSLSIDNHDDTTSVISKIREIINLARGATDLTNVQPYIYYLKADNSFHTKQREDDSSPLATFDIGSGDFRLYDSDDLEGYRTTEDTVGIINKIILNGVDITDISSAGTSQYKTEIAASQVAYGIKEYRIEQDKVNINKITEWLDGFILRLLNPIIKHYLIPDKKTYGHANIEFMGGSNVPDGHIEITKDAAGSTIAIPPFQRCTYRLTSGGWERAIECGEDRPIIDATNLARPTGVVKLFPVMTISLVEPTGVGEQNNAPLTFEIASDDGARVQIMNLNRELLAADPILKYSGVTKTVTWSESDNVYYSENLAKPAKGDTKTIEVISTNYHGYTQTSYAYVIGIYQESPGYLVTITDAADPPSGIGARIVSHETVTYPEYTTALNFEVKYDNLDKYNTETADVKFKIYGIDSTGYYSLLKTITNVSAPAVIESPADSGIFKMESFVGGSGAKAWINLPPGTYGVAVEITRRWNYIDAVGDEQSGSETQEAGKTGFQIVAKTNRIDKDEMIDDIADRLTETTQNASDISDNSDRLDVQEGLLSDDVGEALIQWNDPAWQVTYNGGSSWVDLAADPAGVTHETFTINNDNTDTQYIYLKFDTSDGVKKGLLRFDRNNQKFEISVDGGAGTPSWTDLATGVTNAIDDVYDSTTYQLKVNSSDGSLTFTQDPGGGGEAVLFKLSSTGYLEVYSTIAPSLDDTDTLGTANKRFYDLFVSNAVYTKDIVGTDDGTTERWNITWDDTEQISFLKNMAIGFMDG